MKKQTSKDHYFAAEDLVGIDLEDLRDSGVQVPGADLGQAQGHGPDCSCPRCNMAVSIGDGRRSLFLKKFPEAEFAETLDCDVDRLIWSDLDLQLNHLACRCPRCHTEEVGELLKIVYKKVHYVRKDGELGYFNKQREFADYDQRASILVLADYEHRDRFCRCGLARRDGKSSGCGDIRFCPRCCWNLRTEPVLEEYLDVYGADQEVVFITLSLSRDAREEARIVYKDLTRSEIEQIKEGCLADGLNKQGLRFVDAEDLIQCQAYWDVCKKVIRYAEQKGWFSGAVSAPELAVQFNPVTVLPHEHGVGFSPGFCAENAREMRRYMKRLIRQCRAISDKMHPSVYIYRITSKEDYEAVLKYCFKPIAIERAYGLASAVAGRDPVALARIDRGVERFIENVVLAFSEVHRIRRYGICLATHKGYCGHVTDERKKKRKKEAERRARKRAEEAKVEAQAAKMRQKDGRRKEDDQEKAARLETRMLHKRLVQSGEISPTASTRPKRGRPAGAVHPKPRKLEVCESGSPEPGKDRQPSLPVQLRAVIGKLRSGQPREPRGTI